MEVLIYEIKINEDSFFLSFYVFVMFFWLYGKFLGKRRIILIRRRVIVFGKRE